MAEKTSEQIYLDDGSIRDWDRPLREGYFRMPPVYEASTEPIEVLEVDIIDETLGGYRVVATAAKFRAKIQRINRDKIWEPNPNPVQEEILFSGGITILKHEDKIPGTELTGFDIQRVGKIWTASADVTKMAGAGSLRLIIFGTEQIACAERITSILLGFEKQEEAKQRAQESARSESFTSGRQSTRRNPVERFSRD